MTSTETKEIFVVGAGGHGAEMASYLCELAADSANGIKFAGAIDDEKKPGPWHEHYICGDTAWLKNFLLEHSFRKFYYLTAFGENRLRKSMVEQISSFGTNILPFTLAHPSARTGTGNTIGEGTCLAPGSIVTTHVKIGRHCILNVKASVSHDCVIGDFVNLNPNCTIAGNVRIGEGAFVGAGATVIQKVTIGKWAVIGAGAVVVKDIPDGVTALGVPARVKEQ